MKAKRAEAIRPMFKRTLHAFGGRRVVIEGFGRRSPALMMIVGGGEGPSAVWLSPRAMRRFIEAARSVLK